MCGPSFVDEISWPKPCLDLMGWAQACHVEVRNGREGCEKTYLRIMTGMARAGLVAQNH